MPKQVYLKATLSENVNLAFRFQSRLFNILKRTHKVSDTPVIINNFNRLTYLQQQLEWLNGAGLNNIFIIDNHSTYKPLLSFYSRCPYTVLRLDRNMGHEAIWRTHIYQRFMKSFYVYTDPDVLPSGNTPSDFMEYFYDVLNRYPSIKKVGFGLRTDDLPDYYPKKEEVIKWEAQFYSNEVEADLFKAPIDTTFALYRPGSSFQCWKETLRTGGAYTLRHMPWYEDPNSLSDESLFYLQQASDASSWYKAVSGESKIYG